MKNQFNLLTPENLIGLVSGFEKIFEEQKEEKQKCECSCHKEPKSKVKKIDDGLFMIENPESFEDIMSGVREAVSYRNGMAEKNKACGCRKNEGIDIDSIKNENGEYDFRDLGTGRGFKEAMDKFNKMAEEKYNREHPVAPTEKEIEKEIREGMGIQDEDPRKEFLTTIAVSLMNRFIMEMKGMNLFLESIRKNAEKVDIDNADFVEAVEEMKKDAGVMTERLEIKREKAQDTPSDDWVSTMTENLEKEDEEKEDIDAEEDSKSEEEDADVVIRTGADFSNLSDERQKFLIDRVKKVFRNDNVVVTRSVNTWTGDGKGIVFIPDFKERDFTEKAVYEIKSAIRSTRDNDAENGIVADAIYILTRGGAFIPVINEKDLEDYISHNRTIGIDR